MDRLEEIVNEVIDLLDVPDVFGFLDSSAGSLQPLESRLQEVLQNRQSFETIELATYLRVSSNRSAYLPSWQPLLNASVELGLMRGEPVDDVFYGLIERRPDPFRNTGAPR